MCNFLKVFTLNIVPKVALTYLSICVGYFEKCHFLINIYFGYLRFGQLFPVCVLFIKLQFVFVFPSLDPVVYPHCLLEIVKRIIV